jgi:hypothetical protein
MRHETRGVRRHKARGMRREAEERESWIEDRVSNDESRTTINEQRKTKFDVLCTIFCFKMEI